jgi:recA bacterial DNA recombination protein
MTTRLQISEWLEGDPAGNHATPTPRDTPRPAPESLSDLPLDLAALRGRLISGRELARRQREEEVPELLPTACPQLDRLLAGGLARGHLVELVGGRSSGRFALTLALLAAVTRAGEVAALVDLGDGLDPATAAGAGVELERLLWVRPHHLRQALLGAEILVTTGFPLVALDLGMPPVPHGRIAAPSARAAWLRLARTASSHRAAILLSTPYRTSGAAASEVLDVRSAATRRSGASPGPSSAPALFLGIEARLTLEKARRRVPGTQPGEPGACETLGLSFADEILPPIAPASPPRPASRRPVAFRSLRAAAS